MKNKMKNSVTIRWESDGLPHLIHKKGIRQAVKLHVPTVNDMWFRQECMEDPKTMKYNAGYDVKFDGYDYNTGCIAFPPEKHQTWVDEKLSNPNFYYAYIVDKKTNKFVGYLNIKKDPKTCDATMGIVVKDEFRGVGYMRPSMIQLLKVAKKMGVKRILDDVPENRAFAVKTFLSTGFIIKDKYITKKFGEDEVVCVIEKTIK